MNTTLVIDKELVLPGVPSEDQRTIRVPCPACLTSHTHGLSSDCREGEPSPRRPHCHRPGCGRFDETGYYIQVASAVEVKAFRFRRLKSLNAKVGHPDLVEKHGRAFLARTERDSINPCFFGGWFAQEAEQFARFRNTIYERCEWTGMWGKSDEGAVFCALKTWLESKGRKLQVNFLPEHAERAVDFAVASMRSIREVKRFPFHCVKLFGTNLYVAQIDERWEVITQKTFRSLLKSLQVKIEGWFMDDMIAEQGWACIDEGFLSVGDAEEDIPLSEVKRNELLSK